MIIKHFKVMIVYMRLILQKYQGFHKSLVNWASINPVVPNRWATGVFLVGHGAISHLDMFKFIE